MKWIDCLLISAALGSTLFTTYVFAVHPLDQAPAKTASRSSAFQVAVVHESGSCKKRKEGLLSYHFLIEASGDVVPTLAWKERAPCRSTAVKSINERAISILFDSGSPAHRPRQDRAFRELLDDLQAREGIAIKQVYRHSQVETGGCAMIK